MTDEKEIWILGATGRCGRAIAANLAARGAPVVLVGRDAARLDELAKSLGGARTLLAPSAEDAARAMTEGRPAVVVNTIGPFVETAPSIVRACAPGTHYVDLSNELEGIVDFLARHDEAAANGQCLVAAAGFGVLGTESIALKLRGDRPPALRARVDALPRIDEGGRVGDALAASIVETLAGGGRRYRNGNLERVGVGSDIERFALPDGSEVVSGGVPSGDLEAARRASGASEVVAGSSEIPSGAMARLFFRALGAAASSRAIRGALRRRLARLELPPPKKKRAYTFARARLEWADGTVREGWLRAGDGMTFTARAASEVAFRLANGEGRPGAYTPGALFGPELAEAAGGELLV